jgi:hypothetical protein
MRFMMLVKHAGQSCGAPPKEFMEQLGKLTEDASQSGAMLGGGGLAPVEQSTRIRLDNGNIRIMDGPFAETKEFVGGFAQFEFRSKEDAVAATKKFMELHRDYWPGWEGETEIRQVLGPEDFPPGNDH